MNPRVIIKYNSFMHRGFIYFISRFNSKKDCIHSFPRRMFIILLYQSSVFIHDLPDYQLVGYMLKFGLKRKT